MFCQQLLKVCKRGLRSQRLAHLHLAVVAQLRAHKLRRLQRALQRTGNDDVHLDLEGIQHARHQHALVFSLFNKGPLSIEKGIFTGQAGVGVAHQI